MKAELQNIPLNQVHTRANYRKTFNDKTLKELAQSIKENGVLEPIIVRQNNNGYEVVAGERRFRASQLAKLVTIPAVIRDISDADILKVQIIENVQREGVPFMEEADAIKKLRDDLTLDVAEIAKTLGKSDAYVYMQLKLVAMSDEAQTIARNGWISKGVAWQIARLPNSDYQTQAAADLARPKRDRLITESGAKSYIHETFGDDPRAMAKRRVQKFGKGDDFAANWKYHLVRFDCDQFKKFKTVVRGRTETAVLSEAVDCVMREAK